MTTTKLNNGKIAFSSSKKKMTAGELAGIQVYIKETLGKGWSYDKKGHLLVNDTNTADLETYSFEEAVKMLKSLSGCKNCADCYKLKDSRDCVNCMDSEKLNGCYMVNDSEKMRNCNNCTDCTDCTNCSYLVGKEKQKNKHK